MTTVTSRSVPLIAAAVVFSSGLLQVSRAEAEPSFCQPLSPSARILQSPSPNDSHPNWLGESSVGLSWNLVPLKRVSHNGTSYIKGRLLPPFSPGRGDVYAEYIKAPGELVWVVANEWSC